jgi:hypothetical protein
MKVLSDEYLDRLLAPKAIDPGWVALILRPHMQDHTLQELEALAVRWAAQDGYDCISQAPGVGEEDT